jgi:hypothetical protein
MGDAMKTTIELPDSLFRRAKEAALREGVTLKKLFMQALESRLAPKTKGRSSTSPGWMRAYGALRRLRNERSRLERIIESEFEKVEPEDQL